LWITNEGHFVILVTVGDSARAGAQRQCAGRGWTEQISPWASPSASSTSRRMASDLTDGPARAHAVGPFSFLFDSRTGGHLNEKRPQPSLKNWGRHSNAPIQGATMIGAPLNGRSCFPFLSAKGGPAVIHAGGPIFRHRISCDKSALWNFGASQKLVKRIG
jgi:hypothetical protein